MFLNLSGSHLQAQHANWLIDAGMNVIDGSSERYRHIRAGDTVYLKAGSRDKLLIRNFNGLAGTPITFMNQDGIVTIYTDSYYGISISNCRYIRFSGGAHISNFYGIQIKQVLNGSGIGVGSMSSDVEIDHVSIENCHNSGIMAKTDPECSFQSVRDSFTQFNTSIHDNFISHVGNEGMYIGSSFYAGVTINCGRGDSTLLPAVLNAVQVYNNVVEYPGWDGIQVSSAPLHCSIYNNTVLHDSQAEVQNQMSGILIGGGSKCDCYNNLVKEGKGDGIEDHGLGGNRVYNNIIVNAGQTYLPNDRTKMKHGIFVSDVSVIKDSSFNILFNDIINPKSDGIRFHSIKSKQNLIASNLIINPGNYHWYETDNTAFTGKDAYIMVGNTAAQLQISNNFFAQTIDAAAINTDNYTPLPGSPLINNGYQQTLWLKKDFINNRRPIGGYFDIGAIEYNSGDERIFDTVALKQPLLFPNPVISTLTIRFANPDSANTLFHIYNEKGELLLQRFHRAVTPGMQELKAEVSGLPPGLYVYSLSNGKYVAHGKFIKL